MNFVRSILALAVLAATPAVAETYDTPRDQTELDTRDTMYYNNVIANQANLPSLPGESQADYIIRTSQVPASEVPSIPSDNGLVGREGKLDDASKMALHGERAATASFGRVLGETVALTLSSMSCLTCPNLNADIAQLNVAMENYGQILTAMDYAKQNNDNGKSRLLGSEGAGSGASGGGRSAGTRGGGRSGTQTSSQTASRTGAGSDTVQTAVDNLSPAALDALKAQGVDPNELVERLLSAETDLSDPNTLANALGVENRISDEEMAAARNAPRSERVERILNGDSSGAPGAGNGRVATKKKRRPSKEDDPYYKDPAQAALAGIPLKMFPDGAPEDGGAAALSRFLATLKGKGERGIKKLSAREYYQLLSLGVGVPLHRQTIFQEAHRQYRTFDKYRSGEKTVARNP